MSLPPSLDSVLTPSSSLQTLRKFQLQRLTNLINRKQSVEMDLIKHAGELQEAYERTRGEMQVVLEGRMQDLKAEDGFANGKGNDHKGKGKA